MSALQTFIELAEGTVDVLNVVRERSDRIRARGDGPREVEPSRYGRGKDPSRKPTDTPPPSPQSETVVQATPVAEPTIEAVTDATTRRAVWIVRHAGEQVECYSVQVAQKVRDALR